MGRKAKQIYHNGKLLYHTDGRNIIRVSEDKTNRVFVIFKNGKKVITRREKDGIAQEFYSLIGQKVDVTKHITTGWKPTEQILDYPAPDGTITKKRVHRIAAEMDPAQICSLFSVLYNDDPLKCEALTGIPFLSKLSTMDFNFHSQQSDTTLDAILECYKNRVNEDGSMKEKNKAKTIKDAVNWFGEFRAIISTAARKKVILLSDIHKDHVIKYVNEICKVASQPDYKHKCRWLNADQKKTLKPPYPKRTWIRHRRGKIIGLFTNYEEENYLDSTNRDYQLVQDILTVIKASKKLRKLSAKSKPKPQAVDVQVFHQVFNASGLRWKVLLALAVNAGFTLSELSDLEKSDLDLDKFELIQDRPKTGEFRCAKLDKLTCSLLKEYNDKHNSKNKTIYFFINNQGRKLNAGSMRGLFSKLREKVGIADDIKFKRFRKCIATVATQAGCNEIQIRLVMGHTLKGELGAYIENCIDTVNNVCIAVSDKYFSGLKK